MPYHHAINCICERCEDERRTLDSYKHVRTPYESSQPIMSREQYSDAQIVASTIEQSTERIVQALGSLGEVFQGLTAAVEKSTAAFKELHRYTIDLNEDVNEEQKINNQIRIPKIIEIHDLVGIWLGRVPVSSGEWQISAAGELRLIVRRP